MVDAAAGNSFEVHQAQGMVMIRLGVRPEEALARLRAYAYTHDQRLSEVAGAVIERRLDIVSDKRRAAGEEVE